MHQKDDMNHAKNPRVLGTNVKKFSRYLATKNFCTPGLQFRYIHGRNHQHHKNYFY